MGTHLAARSAGRGLGARLAWCAIPLTVAACSGRSHDTTGGTHGVSSGTSGVAGVTGVAASGGVAGAPASGAGGVALGKGGSAGTHATAAGSSSTGAGTGGVSGTGDSGTGGTSDPGGAGGATDPGSDCGAAESDTALTGRVVTPGRDDGNAANQVGVPNAFVYVVRGGASDLPTIVPGIPEGDSHCDRCEDEDLGPVLTGTVTDATGAFTLTDNLPVGEELTLVVRAGGFRRATTYTIPEAGACKTTLLPTTLPGNPTRLPRGMTDGLAVSIPRIAISTGEVDALECVLEKVGVAHEEFANPGDAGDAAARIHLYRGGDAASPSGARIDAATPHSAALFGDAARLAKYDAVLADCEGATQDSTFAERDAFGANVASYLNRGGRLFASHLSFTWLHGNGTAPYDPADPQGTGLSDAASWNLNTDGMSLTGIGVVALGRSQASPRLPDFAAWMADEMIAVPPDYSFELLEPRSQALALGAATEELLYTTSVTRTAGSSTTETVPDNRSQAFAFDTPYAAPAAALCGRVEYSGFHVATAAPDVSLAFAEAVFPEHCTGDLTQQEAVLLYMLFDLTACLGDPRKASGFGARQ